MDTLTTTVTLLQKKISEAGKNHFSRQAQKKPRTQGHRKSNLFQGGSDARLS